MTSGMALTLQAVKWSKGWPSGNRKPARDDKHLKGQMTVNKFQGKCEGGVGGLVNIVTLVGRLHSPSVF